MMQIIQFAIDIDKNQQRSLGNAFLNIQQKAG